MNPLLYVFAVVHATLGAWLLWSAVRASFGDAWVFVAVGGPLLVAHAIGVTLRREAIDRKIGNAIAMTLRLCGAFAMVVGALMMRTELGNAGTVIGVSAVIAMWGVAYGWVLDRSGGAFGQAIAR